MDAASRQPPAMRLLRASPHAVRVRARAARRRSRCAAVLLVAWSVVRGPAGGTWDVGRGATARCSTAGCCWWVVAGGSWVVGGRDVSGVVTWWVAGGGGGVAVAVAGGGGLLPPPPRARSRQSVGSSAQLPNARPTPHISNGQ
jgi:hypothetical protein